MLHLLVFVSSSCLLTGLIFMCIRMKHFPIYMASAGSIFTCSHLSPLVLPNTLAMKPLCFHCHRLLWRLSLYYFIHCWLSSPESVSVIMCWVCECFLLLIPSNFYLTIKDERSPWGKLTLNQKCWIHMNRLGFITLWCWILFLYCNCLLLDVTYWLLQPTNKDFLRAFPVQLFVLLELQIAALKCSFM